VKDLVESFSFFILEDFDSDDTKYSGSVFYLIGEYNQTL